jgi:hypothetical protein
LAVIMDAMKENRNVIVKGEISKQLLSNLVEYQAVWHKWLPDVYDCIDISVDFIKHDIACVPGAISAFSGGVDGTFSVWRHSQDKCSHRSQKINLCSMVHGFDIPLSNEVAFDNASKRAEKTLSDINIGLVPIKTNYRQISKVGWEDSFACALVATLSNFKKMAGTCIVGSGGPYNTLVMPWGSTPISDHLLSASDFIVMHDGASHSRTEKVKEIADWRMGIDNLRVCWQGDLKDRNCGKCEKCIRTQLNFLAIGKSIPQCFSEANIINNLKTVLLYNDPIRVEWKEIYNYARRNKINESWIDQLPVIIHGESFLDKLLPRGSSRRGVVKNIVKKITQKN